MEVSILTPDADGLITPGQSARGAAPAHTRFGQLDGGQ